MSVKSKHSVKKSSVEKKERKKKLEDSDEDFESSEEELDLTKECHPIGYYLNDKTEMVNQMFSVIKGNKLRAMLPPILKECDTEQLKLQCLDQLLGMSEKRITSILEGETLETSSESDIILSDECESDEEDRISDSSSQKSESSQNNCQSNNASSSWKKRKRNTSNEGKVGKFVKTEPEPSEQGKTLLEILELEMRARAIRALLKQSNHDQSTVQVTEESKTEINCSKEASNEVVDLTECEDDESSRFISVMKKEDDKDTKFSNLEKKPENSNTENSGSNEDEKFKKLRGELDLRNKLFRKKFYRTRQQRIESEEELFTEKSKTEEILISGNEKIGFKQDFPESEGIIVEDFEEGEINSSEDNYPIEFKQEGLEKPINCNFNVKVNENAEKTITNDNVTFTNDTDSSIVLVKEKLPIELQNFIPEEKTSANNEKQKPEEDLETTVKETSWRDRWLQKDGVQKLVKSSKICAKVKKRIAEKSQKAKMEALTPYEVNSDSNSNSKLEMIEGSIEEYERLLSKNQESKELNFEENENSHQSVSDEIISELSENLVDKV